MTTTIDRTALARTIAVVCAKGGVGKTTLTANVAGLLADAGHRVLAIDLDPQGSLGLDLAYAGTTVDDRGQSLAASLLFGTALDPTRSVRPGLDVVVGGGHLAHAHAALVGTDAPTVAQALARTLAPIAGEYDAILIDCPPGGPALQRAALGAARWVIAPVRGDTASQRGLVDLTEQVDAVLPFNPNLDLLGVAIFGVEVAATRVREATARMVADVTGDADLTFDAVVRHSSAVASQVRSRGLLVHELEGAVKAGPSWWEVRRGEGTTAGPRSAGSVADDLRALTIEIVTRLSRAENADG